MNIRTILGAASAVAYVTTIATANWATSCYGLIPVGFGLTATAGVWAAGLALSLRDAVQDTLGRAAVLAAIGAGAGLSWVLANPALAVASAAAFAVSEVADWAVYTPLRRRGWMRAVLASNTVGALVDTVAFLTLAGFGLATTPGQLVGKGWATLAVVATGVGVRRVVPRQSLHPAGA